MKKFSTTITTMALIASFVFLCTSSLQAKIYYVQLNAGGLNNGSSWPDAFSSLQDAIDTAAEGDSIFVTAGTYLPTFKLNGNSDLNLTFYINKDISLFGGFEGVPGTEGNFSVRNPKVFVTTLTGDIGVPGDSIDNVFHVVYIDQVSDTMQLDGFTIADAYGFLGGGFDNTGGGIFLDAEAGRCSPVISNCVIRDNEISESGAGVAGYASSGGVLKPRFVNCAFINNVASGGGGYFGYVDTEGEESAVFISCDFKGNKARTSMGGAIGGVAHSSISNQVLVNCVITGNDSPTSTAYSGFVTGTGLASPRFINCTIVGNTGGSIRIADLGTGASGVTVRNSIVWGNPNGHGISTNGGPMDVAFSLVQFSFPGEGNISLDPEYVNEPLAANAPHTEGDVHIKSTSAAIDAGRNSDVPNAILTDKDGNPRFVNPSNGQAGKVDMGAFELQEFPVSTRPVHASLVWRLTPNPASHFITVNLPEHRSKGYIMLTNSEGRQIKYQPFEAQTRDVEIRIDDIAGGVYYAVVIIDSVMDVRSFYINR